jgi:hypothetical protein
MAITVDSTSEGYHKSTGSGTVTASHTCSGSNRILWVATLGFNNPISTCTGVTYNGAALTQIGTGTIATYQKTQLWYLIAPDTGTHDIVASFNQSNVTVNAFAAVSYNGALQSGVPDASNTNNSASASSLTASVTTVANNCWTVMAACAGGLTHNGTGTTLRKISTAPSAPLIAIMDSNGAKTPAGSVSLVTDTNGQGNTEITEVIASFAPTSSIAYTLSAATASLSLTSVNTTLRMARIMPAATASMTLTPINANLIRPLNYILRAATATLSLVGNSVRGILTSFPTFTSQPKSSASWTAQQKTE